MDSEEKIKNNGHVIINGFKGIYTMEEVIDLLHSLGLKVKISMSAKGDDSVTGEEESPNLVVRR